MHNIKSKIFLNFEIIVQETEKLYVLWHSRKFLGNLKHSEITKKIVNF